MDWVKPNVLLDALDLDGGTATRAICKRARAGLLRTRAHTFIRGKQRQHDVELPDEFWWAGGEAALEQDWTTGDFSTWIEGREEWKAFSVTFSREDAELMGADFAHTRRPRIEVGSLFDYAIQNTAADRPLWDWLEVSAWLVHRSFLAVDGVAGVRATRPAAAPSEVEALIEFMLYLDHGAQLQRERSKLENLCLSGSIVAKGRADGGDLSAVPADAWDSTKVYPHDGEWWLAPKRLFEPASARRTQYAGLRFLAADIRTMFPEAVALDDGARANEINRSDAVSEEDLRNWFTHERIPAVTATMTQVPRWADCYKEAQRFFAPRWVTDERLRAARKQACPDIWSKRGPSRPLG